MLCVEPRSIWIHCGSLAALLQRVVALPSTARLGVVPAFSFEDDVAVLARAMLAVPQPAGTGVGVLVRGGGLGIAAVVLVRGGGLVIAAAVLVRVGVFCIAAAVLVTGWG